MVLAKHASQVASTEEYTSGAVVPRNAGFLAMMRSNDIHLYRLGADQAVTRLLISIDAT